ncbi:hypothetical protein MMC34_001202 [Xylographa carneopallida]|nr:hypothetical protein [Xylographa carneopallida]
MPSPSPSRKPPTRYDQGSSGSLSGLERVIAPASASPDAYNHISAETLNRPLPAIPTIRRSSSVYSLQSEDIIDYYGERRSYVWEDPVSEPEGEILAPTSLSPSSIQMFLRHQSNADGSFSSPVPSADKNSSYTEPNSLAGSRDKPEWTIQGTKTKPSRHHYQPSKLSSARSEATNSRYNKSIADSASFSSSIRPISPGTVPRSSRTTDSISIVSSTRAISPRTLLKPSRFENVGSTVSSIRSVSPISQPQSTRKRPENPQRHKRQDPPAPISLHARNSSRFPVSRSPVSPDPYPAISVSHSPVSPELYSVPYPNEHEYLSTPISARITQLVEHTLVPSPLRNSRLPSVVSQPSHESIPSTVGTSSSASKTLPERPSYLNWSYNPPPLPSPTRSTSIRPASPPRPTTVSHPPQQSPTPALPHETLTAEHYQQEQQDQRMLQNFHARYPSSSAPPFPPPAPHKNRLPSLTDRMNDMYDTLTSIPKPSFPKPSLSMPKHKSTPAQNPSSPAASFPISKLRPSLSLKRPSHKRSNTVATSKSLSSNQRSPNSPRPINRNPAIPITPYQYMGPKAWEDAPTPKRKSGQVSPKERLSSLFGGLMKGKEEKKEEERKKRREELKKKIVVVGLEGEAKDVNRAGEGDWM